MISFDGCYFLLMDSMISLMNIIFFSCPHCCLILGLTSVKHMYFPQLMDTPLMFLWWMDGH